MKRKLFVILALSALCLIALPGFAETGDPDTVVTIVHAPDQAGPERPPCFPDPADDYIPLPDTENFALNRPVVSGAHTDVYVDKNVNDGSTDTYWESRGFPAEIAFDLGEERTVTAVAVCLNPSAIWEPRIQEIAVMVSADGENYIEAAPAEKYQFDAATGNRIRIDLEAVQATWVKVVFTLNTSSRTGGAQAAEIGIY